MKYIIYQNNQCAFCGHVMYREFLHYTMKETVPRTYSFEAEPNIMDTCMNDICPQYNKPMKVKVFDAEEI